MAPLNPVLMPISTSRLLIRPKQVGDGTITSVAIAETWEDLHKWMRWAEDREGFTAELMEIRNRQVMASFILREGIELIGIEVSTGTAVVWCGLHDIDWQGRQCDTGYWVRKTAQGQGIATEATNAMVRYAFGALGMRRIGLTHSAGNEADALLNDSASPSRVSREVRMYFQAASMRTGTATRDWMSLVCRAYRCTGK